jgi:heme-degrading monooxygenase HmoA
MFVAINSNIPLKKNAISDFEKWFEESNKEISKSSGFVARRLLKSSDGTYTIMAEWESREQFEKLHSSDTHKRLHQQARSHMEKDPEGPKFYEVIVG